MDRSHGVIKAAKDLEDLLIGQMGCEILMLVLYCAPWFKSYTQDHTVTGSLDQSASGMTYWKLRSKLRIEMDLGPLDHHTLSN